MIANRHCERCGEQTLSTVMSMFNTDQICLKCKEEESKHPRYKEAVEAEREAIRGGDFNFPGIGWSAVPVK